MRTLTTSAVSMLSVVLALAAAARAGAQTAPNSTDQPVTMIGCVSGAGTTTSPFLLSNVTRNPEATPSSPEPENIPAVTVGAASAGNVSPGAVTTPSAFSGSFATAGIGGLVVSTNTTAANFRLSGSNMQPFLGQRVQVTGTVTPAFPSDASASGGTLIGAGGTTTPEFHVTNVVPVGSCS